MKVTVKLPKVSDSDVDAAVIELACEPGTVVTTGDTLLTVETDKATVDVPTPVAGTILEVLVAVDDELAVGAPIMVIDTA